MKSLKKFLFLFVLVFALTSSYAQIKDPDTMVHKIFATLKAKDQKAFVALYPNSSQFQNMMRTLMEMGMRKQLSQQSEADKEKTKDINIDSIVNLQLAAFSKPEVAEQLQNKFGMTFSTIIKKGEEKGIDWSAVKLINYTYDTSVVKKDSEDEMMASLGFKNMKGVIDFTSSGDSAYQMSFDKIIYVPANGGWFGGEFQQIIRKGESFSDVDIVDVMITDTAAGPPPPPPPPPRKIVSKTKLSGAKTKIKTKTPARKQGTKS